jgi:hypothetical protein
MAGPIAQGGRCYAIVLMMLPSGLVAAEELAPEPSLRFAIELSMNDEIADCADVALAEEPIRF